jgi:hypothetical protein
MASHACLEFISGGGHDQLSGLIYSITIDAWAGCSRTHHCLTDFCCGFVAIGSNLTFVF